MVEGKAEYFDGSSSKSFDCGVRINTETGDLNLDLGTESLNWNVRDLKRSNFHDNLTLRRDGFPDHLVIRDKHLIDELEKFKPESGFLFLYNKLISAGTGVHLLILLFIVGLFLSFNFLIIPGIAQRAAVMVPESYDESLGQTFYENYIQYEKVDSVKSQLVQEFASQIDFNHKRPLTFTVVNSPQVNAFALPDGNIIIFKGIIDQMESYEELVALMGHEASHVSKRHSMKMLCRNLSTYLFVSAVLSDINGIMAILGENANQLNSLSFSRELETEADEGAFDILLSNEITAEGIFSLFERLQETGSNGLSVPDFLRSHPLTDDRIDHIRNKLGDKEFVNLPRPELDSLFTLIKEFKSDIEDKP